MNTTTTRRKTVPDALRPIGDAVLTPVALAVDYLIPQIESISWCNFILLSVIVSVPAAGYITGFTKIGYGLPTFNFLSRYYGQHAYILALSLAGFSLLLYLLDVYYWDSSFGIFMRYIAVSILVLATAVLVGFISTSHPYGPISLYIVIMPIWLVAAKNVFHRHLRMRTYVPWLSGPLFFNAVVIMALWVNWTFHSDTNEWTESTRLADAQISGCVPDLEMYPECQGEFSGSVCFDPTNPKLPVFDENCPHICVDVYDKCSGMFIIWVGPFLVSLGLLFLSFFASFLRETGTVDQEAIRFTKMWFFLLFALWIASSLAGAGAGVSVTLAVLTLSAFVASAILIALSFNHVEREEKVTQLWMNLIKKYDQYLNIARGLLVVTSAPVFVIYVTVSVVNQCVRNINLPCSRSAKKDSENLKDAVGEQGLVTAEARRLIQEVKSWELFKVFTYAIYWGTGFMTFGVLAAKFTTLFLSWLIEETKDMEISVVSSILIGVGTIMFLLPPVPGAPIYLTFGIVMVPVGRESMGITYSILYAMGASLVLKIFATFLQQKMIGGLLQNSVSIRQMVGINTPLIRAFKLILAENGFSMAKVSILCGGPDWPTSVLCGVMDLSSWPILVGTMPVLILIVPTVLAGSFTYMGSLTLDGQPEFAWAGTAATISTASAALVLVGFMIKAAYYVEQTMRERKEEIAELPFDKEVKKLDDEQVLKNKAFDEVTEWKLVPGWAKFCLILSLICMIISCYIVQVFQEDAFTSYQLTYTIDRHLGGDWMNLVKPLGWIALFLFVASLLLFSFVNKWAKRKVKNKLQQPVTRQESAVLLRVSVGPQEDRDSGV